MLESWRPTYMAVTKHAIAVYCPCTLHLCCCRSKVKCASVQDLFTVNLTVNLLDVFLLTCFLLGWLCRGLGSGEGVSFSGVNREKGLNQWCIFKYFFNYRRWLTCSSPSWSLNAIFVARGCQMSVKKSLYRYQLKCSCSHVTATQAVQIVYGGWFTHWVCVALSWPWKPGGAFHLSCSFLTPVLFFYVMTLLVEMNTSRDLLLAGCNTVMG